MFRKESGAQRNGVTDQSQRRPRRGYGRSVRKTKVNMSVIEGGEADVSDLSSISNNDVHVGRRSMGHLCGREVIVTYITIAPARCEEEINIRVELSHHRSLGRHPDCFGSPFWRRSYCRISMIMPLVQMPLGNRSFRKGRAGDSCDDRFPRGEPGQHRPDRGDRPGAA
jgi:hypothetical protein